jgi:hypothetical protein
MSSQSQQDLSNFQTLVSVATERPRLTIEQQKNILNQNNNSNVKSFFSSILKIFFYFLFQIE